jgi:hypothetical protein
MHGELGAVQPHRRGTAGANSAPVARAPSKRARAGANGTGRGAVRRRGLG